MLTIVIVVLIVLWLLGYIHIDGLTIPRWKLFEINNQPITLWEVLIFIVMIWAIGVLPKKMRQLATVLFIVWILAVLGIISVAGLSNILVLILIVALVLAALKIL